jgi:hypothetical protein
MTMDKEKATKLLGFRDEQGKLVCPADVVDLAKPYEVFMGADDGSWEPTADEAKRIGELLKGLGLKGSLTVGKGKGGEAFMNKKGMVICRMVEAKEAPAPKPKAKDSEDTTEKTAPRDEDLRGSQEEVKASAKATVSVSKGKPSKKKTKRKGSSSR